MCRSTKSSTSSCLVIYLGISVATLLHFIFSSQVQAVRGKAAMFLGHTSTASSEDTEFPPGIVFRAWHQNFPKAKKQLIVFESFKWTDNNYKPSRTTKNSKSLKNETFAIACSGTKDRVVALQNSFNQMNLPDSSHPEYTRDWRNWSISAGWLRERLERLPGRFDLTPYSRCWRLSRRFQGVAREACEAMLRHEGVWGGNLVGPRVGWWSTQLIWAKERVLKSGSGENELTERVLQPSVERWKDGHGKWV